MRDATEQEVAEFIEWLYDGVKDAGHSLSRGMVGVRGGHVDEDEAAETMIWCARAMTFLNQLRVKLECDTGNALHRLGFPTESREEETYGS